LICLHTHWALLRPCRVELPVQLGAWEREFWLRLIDNVTVQLEAYGSVRRPGRAVELVGMGPQLEPTRQGSAGNRAAVAFSGGKDSLVLAALLAELTERPLLVTTTSPVAWARDHVGVARERARAEMARLMPVDVIEVRSDFRTCWDLGFSARDGCTLGVHELSDLPLYQAATMAAAAASGRCTKLAWRFSIAASLPIRPTAVQAALRSSIASVSNSHARWRRTLACSCSTKLPAV